MGRPTWPRSGGGRHSPHRQRRKSNNARISGLLLISSVSVLLLLQCFGGSHAYLFPTPRPLLSEHPVASGLVDARRDNCFALVSLHGFIPRFGLLGGRGAEKSRGVAMCAQPPRGKRGDASEGEGGTGSMPFGRNTFKRPAFGRDGQLLNDAGEATPPRVWQQDRDVRGRSESWPRSGGEDERFSHSSRRGWSPSGRSPSQRSQSRGGGWESQGSESSWESPRGGEGGGGRARGRFTRGRQGERGGGGRRGGDKWSRPQLTGRETPIERRERPGWNSPGNYSVNPSALTGWRPRSPSTSPRSPSSSESGAGGYKARVLLPKNLSAYRGLHELLEELERCRLHVPLASFPGVAHEYPCIGLFPRSRINLFRLASAPLTLIFSFPNGKSLYVCFSFRFCYCFHLSVSVSVFVFPSLFKSCPPDV